MAAIEGISITLDQVTSAANSIDSINQDLYNKLQEVKTQMNNLTQSWHSDAADTIHSKFNALAPRFDDYRQVIDNYVKFLHQTVDTYNSTENQINSNASSFK